LQNPVLIFITDSSDKHGFLCLFLAKPRWWGVAPLRLFRLFSFAQASLP